MSLDVAKKAIDVILNEPIITSKKYVTFDFIGGEPLLEIDLISDITEYLIQTMADYHMDSWLGSYRINITTNGLMYRDAKVQQYIAKHKEHLNISISIDGDRVKNDKNRVYPSGKGSYDDLIPNVELWVRQWPLVNTRMTISHDDLPYVNDALQHLIKCGIHNIDVNPVLEDVWSDGDEVIFENELKKFAEYMVKHPLRDKLIITCFDGTIGHPLGKSNRVNTCGVDMLTIDAKGNFYTCLRFAAFSLREKPARAIGNIDTGININLLRPYLVVSPDVMLRGEKCIDCDIATGCKYCPAENYDASISDTIFERSTNICKMHRAKVNAKNYYFSLLQ
jgi:radical SAM peptide maturase (CXXX-repeat target family)